MNRITLFFLIIFVATLLRFVALGENPPSLTWDEAAWGYNAYTLGVDGRDEFGRLLPIDYLESFGDFKPPMYAYLTVIPVKVLGLTEFAVRFPSAFFGVLTIVVTYFLILRLFSHSKNKHAYALVAMGILAISPWHILLSRAAFEANIATFLIVCGVWLFLKGIQEKSYILVLAAVAFALSFYTFNTPRVFVPILLLLLAFGFRRELLRQKQRVLISAVVGMFFLLPLIPFLLTPQASLRFREVNIFTDISVIDRTNRQIANDNNALWSRIIHNRRFAYAGEFFKHYFDNLTPQFLFITGDGNPKFSTQQIGQMYVWEIPFLIAGVLFLIKKKEGFWWLVPLWLLVGIIPAATARETPHALRIETTLPTFQILVAYGVVSIFSVVKKTRVLLLAILGLVIVAELIAFQHDYYAHYKIRYSREWQYGYKEAVNYINQVENQYRHVNITTALGRPYVYVLLHSQTNPDLFRNTYTAEREAAGFVTVTGFGKYRFSDNLGQFHAENSSQLFIEYAKNVPQGANVLQTFSALDGEPILVAYTL